MIQGVEIQLGPQCGAGGWHLLQGQLRRLGGTYDARLYFDVGDGFTPQHCLPVPTSAQGAIKDLLCLPAGVRRLALDPGPCAEVSAAALRIRAVGDWERRWRMVQRVVPLLLRQQPAKRMRIGLTWLGLASNLQQAYETASRLRAHAAAPSYEDWIRRFDTLGVEEERRIRRQVQGWPDGPVIHVLLVGEGDPQRKRSLASLEAQLYRSFTVTECLDEQASGSREEILQRARPADWVMRLCAGDVLAPHALYWFAHAARSFPQATVLFADDDELDAQGQRCRPRFKPDWSWAHVRSTDFTGAATLLRADALGRAGGLGAGDLRHGGYDALLRVLDDAQSSSAEEAVRHIPAVLLSRAGEEPDPARTVWQMDAVRAHLARRGVAASVESPGGSWWRVRHQLPKRAPMVSIIVPTRDALPLTRLCIDSLRTHTSYAHYEILLVDNQSSEPAALEWMRAQADTGAIRLLRYDAPFNYAAINNMAVAQARGELVLLLNNDTEVTHPDWLEEMVSQAMQPGVDVVGAKLLYSNGLVQHAGDLVGVGGVANHAHAWLGANEPGYCNRALVAQEYSAVTGACLLTWRHRYLALGGLDAARLPVAFNDVDYCLRVREAGGHVVWTPHAVLVHHESVSRGKDLTRQTLRRARREAAWMRRRWRDVLGKDPFYNPNLSHERPDFSLSHAPVVSRPWLP